MTIAILLLLVVGLAGVHQRLIKLTMKVSEVAAFVNAQGDVLDKIIKEIQALKDSLSDVDLPQDAVDALTRLSALTKQADELNPDAPTTTG